MHRVEAVGVSGYNAPMSDERIDKAGGPFAILAVLCTARLIAAYPLSAGPVEWAFNKGYLSDACSPYAHAHYAPLIWLIEHADWFEKLAEWYLSLWR